MKRIKDYTTFLLEKFMILDDIYTKYYSNIDRAIFDKIVNSDPTTKGIKMGIYCKWLLNLFNNKKLKLEDLYKATEYLEAFHSFKHKLSINDINKIDSLPTLFKLVEPYLKKDNAEFSNEDERKFIGQFKQIFKNDKYRIIIPLTLKASQYFGQDTEWCTTNTDMFKQYTRNQTDKIDDYALYILYTEDPDDRLQFHFNTRQFMDVTDSQIDIKKFFEENKDIKDFFNKYFRVAIYIEIPEYVVTELLSDEYGLNVVITDGEWEEWEEEFPNWKERFDVVIFYTDYDENPMDGSPTFEFRYNVNSDDNNIKFQNMVRDIYKNCTMNVDFEDDCYIMYANI